MKSCPACDKQMMDDARRNTTMELKDIMPLDVLKILMQNTKPLRKQKAKRKK